jgi:hypothetical protein
MILNDLFFIQKMSLRMSILYATAVSIPQLVEPAKTPTHNNTVILDFHIWRVTLVLLDNRYVWQQGFCC